MPPKRTARSVIRNLEEGLRSGNVALSRATSPQPASRRNERSLRTFGEKLVLLPESSVVELDQVELVNKAAHAAVEARQSFQRLRVEIAELERAAIDTTGRLHVYALQLPFTVTADTLFGYLMLAGAFDEFGTLGRALTLLLALFMGVSAVIVELFAAHLYRTKRRWAVRAAAFAFSVMIPAGLIWILMVLQHALAVNTNDSAAVADIKLWIFGGIAIAMHIFIFLAGDRVLRGLRQVRNRYRVYIASRYQAKAYAAWQTWSREVIRLDHRLRFAIQAHNTRNSIMTILMPIYDVITEHLLAELNQCKGVPDIEGGAVAPPPPGPPDSELKNATGLENQN
jgi:hypothetical protein